MVFVHILIFYVNLLSFSHIFFKIVYVMLDFLFNILIILTVWLGVYAVYSAVIVFASTKSRRFVLEQKYNDHIYNNNLIVIVYAHNNEKTVVPLLEMLNRQKYPRNHFQTHIILDNCSDNSSNILEFVGGAKIWRVGDNYTVGKDESISWLLERLASSSSVDAFVFLHGNRIIDDNFLKHINADLFKNDVIIGKTQIVDTYEKTFVNKIIVNYQNFYNNIIQSGKAILKLPTTINSDVLVMKQKVLETMQSVNFKNPHKELEYTARLIKAGFIPLFNPTINTFVELDNFRFKQVRNGFRLRLFFHYIKQIFKSPYQMTFFAISLIYPSAVAVVLWTIFIMVFDYYLYVDFIPISLIAAIFIFSSVSAIFIARVDFLSLVCYPVYRFLNMLAKFPIINFVLRLVFRRKNVENTEKMNVDIEVTDGKNDLPCKLELICEDGLCKTVFRYKKKRYSSKNHLRMFDAIKDIVDKLAEHGLRLKICQACGYFTPQIDGSTNMIKGLCHRAVLAKTAIRASDTLLWKACEYFAPLELNKVVDINDFKSNR